MPRPLPLLVLGAAWGLCACGAVPALAQAMFIGQHGAWNRRPHSGYKAAPIPFVQGKPVGEPVGVVLDHQGDLMVAVDVGNVVWRVRRAWAS